MAENLPINKSKEPDQDLGFATALAQSFNEPMVLEKDATNVSSNFFSFFKNFLQVFFKRFLKHCLSMEKFSKKLLMRFQKLLEMINREGS